MAIDKQVNVTITGKDELTPQVNKAALSIKENLVKSINSSNLSMRAKQKAILAVNRQLEENAMVNEELADTVRAQKNAFEASVVAIERFNKAMEGGRQSVDLVNRESETLENTLEKVANTSAFGLIVDGFKSVAKIAGLTVASLVGVNVIPSVLKGLTIPLQALEDQLFKLSFRSDELLSDFAEYGPNLERAGNVIRAVTKQTKDFLAIFKGPPEQQLSLFPETVSQRIVNNLNRVKIAGQRIADGMQRNVFIPIGQAAKQAGDAMKVHLASMGDALERGAYSAAKWASTTNFSFINVVTQADKVAQTVGFKLKKAWVDFQKVGVSQAINQLNLAKNALKDSESVMKLFLGTAKQTAGGMAATAKVFGSAARHTELFEKGLAGTVARATVANTAFAALGTTLLKSDSVIAKLSGVTLVGLAVALGGVVTVVNYLISSISSFISNTGNQLTNWTYTQIEAFAKAEETTFAFEQTLRGYSKSAEEAVQQTAMWTDYIEESSNATGQTAATLRSLVAETVGATSALGLNSDQMEELIDRSIDLSERAHKPAIDTLTALINALNGNSAGLAIYGLHLNQAAIEHSNLNEELKSNFKNLGDNEKALARYSVLMEQASKASGFASNNADLYTKGLKLQENAFKTLNAELGKGAAIVNGQVVVGLANATTALTNLLKPVLPLIGYFTALGGRILQVTGFLTSHILMITLLTSSYRALNILLAKASEQAGFFSQKLPLINKSVNDVVKSLGVTNGSLKSLGDVGKTTFKILNVQAQKAVVSMLGLQSSTKLTTEVFGKGLLLRARQVGRALTGVGIGTRFTADLMKSKLAEGAAFAAKKILFLDTATKLTARTIAVQLAKGFLLAAGAAKAFLVAVLPIAIKVGLVVAAFMVLKKAFEVVEERTQIFSRTWERILKLFEGTNPVVAAMSSVFKVLSTVMTNIFMVAVNSVAAAISGLLSGFLLAVQGIMKLTRLLSSILPKSLVASEEALNAVSNELDTMWKATKKLSGEALSGLGSMFMSNAEAATKTGLSYDKLLSKIHHLESAYKKVREKGRDAFSFAGEFAPALQLDLTKEAAKKATKQLEAMRDKASEIKKAYGKLMGPLTPTQTADLDKIKNDVVQAEQALKAIKLKIAQEERAAKLAEVDLELRAREQKSITVEQEIAQMRIDAAQGLRDRLIDIETQRILEQRGLADTEATTVNEAAIIAANERELELFRAKLNAQKALALDMEAQKQIEIAQVKAAALGGSGGGDAAAKDDIEIMQAQLRVSELQRLRDADLISAQEHQIALNQVSYDLTAQGIEQEIMLHKTKAERLGLTPAGLAARQAQLMAEHAMELEQINLHEENKTLTKEEANMARENAEMQRMANMNQIQQNFIQQEISRHEMLGNSWQATLARMRLEQQKHGAIMGTIRALQASQEFGALQGALGNLSSLRNSKSRKAFQVGKTAAIAQATINTFMGATAAFSALAGIPIVGPALATAAAAAAIAAGVVNIQNIKAQKFNPGGQADQGIDSIPKSLSGKSFILSAGERVVQPEANKDLTGFLAEQRKSGGGGHTINITVQGNASADTVEEIKRAVIEGIREASERGEPIINQKGIVA